MFRKEKDLTERSQTLLKNKELKQLKADITKQFPYFNEHSEELNVLLPNKCDLTCTKLVNRTLLYTLEGNVLFFDVEGRNNLYPTIYTLSKYPDMLINIYVWSPVSRFILKGADFMIPGFATLEGTEQIREKSKCCLRVIGNPVPFAVGTSLIDYRKLVVDRAEKGKALSVLHSWGDLISPKVPPNEGFHSLIQISPTERVENENDGGMEDDNDQDSDGKEGVAADLENLKLDSAEGDMKLENNEESEIVNEGEGEDGENQNDEEEDNEEDEADAEEGEGDEDDNEEDQNDNDEDNSNPKENNHKGKSRDRRNPKKIEASQRLPSTKLYANDEELMETLIITLKYFVKDKQLPILVSGFWALLQKYVSNEEMIIDIKKTSYKKVSFFLQNYCQNNLGLLKLGENISNNHDQDGIGDNNDQSGNILSLISINRSHELFGKYKISNLESFKEEIKQRELKHAAMVSANIAQNESLMVHSLHHYITPGGGNGKTNAIELLKMPKKLKEIFELRMKPLPSLTEANDNHNNNKDYYFETKRYEYGEYMKYSELKELLGNYVKLFSLEIPDKKSHLLITSEDPFYEYVESYQKATGSTASSVAVAKKVAAPAVPTAMKKKEMDDFYPPLPPSIDEDQSDDLDYMAANQAQFMRSGGGGGLDPWMFPTPGSSTAPEIKMKIHKDGLKDVNSLPDNYVQNFPTLSTLSSSAVSSAAGAGNNNKMQTSKIAGGSRVGGWGRDPSKPFKPIELPPAAAAPNNNSNKKAAAPAKGSLSSSTAPTSGGMKGLVMIEKKEEKKSKAVDSFVDDGEVRILQVSKEDFMKAMVTKMVPYHAIILPDGQVDIRSGNIPKIKILTEHRAGNKMVTMIRGLEAYHIDLTQLSKQCQKKFACSVSISSVPGIAKEKEILLQGNYPQEVEQFLLNSCHLPRTVVEVLASQKAKKSGKR